LNLCLLQLPLATTAKETAKPLMDRLADLPVPTPSQVLDHLQHLAAWQAAILLVAGFVYMIWGWKIFKALVSLNLACVGFVLGTMLAQTLIAAHPSAHDPHWPLYGGLIGAGVLAILAWPLMKFAVSLMGAAAGAFGGYQLWHYLCSLHKPEWVPYSWVGGLVGGLLAGALAFVLFRTIVMFFTSLQGAVLSVAGGLSLALNVDSWRDSLRNHLLKDQHLWPLLVIVPTVAGFLFQALSMARKKSPAAPQKKAKS
jgi:hypothetical protein